METVAIIIHIVVSLLIIVAVLLQSGKGASMGASFGGSTSSQALFGSVGPASMLTKITAACAVVFMLTSLYITYKSGHKDTDSIMMDVPTVNLPGASDGNDVIPDPLAPSPEKEGVSSPPADTGALKKTVTTGTSAEEPVKK